MIASLKDIAKATGFSINTVSHALRDSDRVKPETKEIIKKVAGEMRYIPHGIARSLVKRKSFLIALVIHSIEDPFYASLINTIEKIIYPSEYSLILFNHNEDTTREDMIIRSVLQQKIDGVIIIPALSEIESIQKLISYEMPFVVVIRPVEDYRTNFVGIDFKEGMQMVVDHFVKYRRKKILMINGSNITTSSKMRFEGYKNALRNNNIRFNKDLVIDEIKNKEFLFHRLDILIKQENKINAIYCYDFKSTAAIVEYCNLNKISIPDDVALIGYEFEEFSKNTLVPITSLKYKASEMGESAWMILQSIIDKKQIKDTVQNVYTKPELIIRRSCGETT